MPVDIVVGGQAGDEGKGKISAYLAWTGNYDYCIKVGGPNAGHTVFFKNKIYPLKTVPSGFVNKKAKLVLGAGTYLILDWLFKEIKDTDTDSRLSIDPNAVVIEKRQIEIERSNDRIMKTIGSVGTGLGVAIGDRIARKEIRFAKDEPSLKKYIRNVPEMLNNALEKGKKVLLEGTQGFKLSLLHGEYPYVTSRDTTASTFLAEAGLGPKYVRDIYVVFKPYVTRTGPGPLENEVRDAEVLKKVHTRGREVGSVSGRLRRVGSFEFQTAKKTIMVNSATKIAVTHIDIFDGNSNVRNVNNFTREAKDFLNKIQELSKIYPYPKLSLISTGPGLLDIIKI